MNSAAKSTSIVDDLIAELEKLVAAPDRAAFEAQLRPQLSLAHQTFGDQAIRVMLADVKLATAAVADGRDHEALRIAAKYGMQAALAAQLDARRS